MSTISERLTAAAHLHQTGKLDQAEPLYRQILEEEPTHTEALRLLGLLTHQRGDSLGALGYFQQAITFEPANPLLHTQLARVYQSLGQWDEARRSYEAALTLQPDSSELHNHLGILHAMQGYLDEAIEHYQTALRLKPDYAGAQNNLGMALDQQGREAEAEAAFREAIRLQPSSAESHYNLGNTLKRQGKLEEAATCYEAALRLKGNYLKALNNLGNVRIQQGRLEEAVAQYQEVLAIDPANASAYNNLGGAFHELGQLQEALNCLRHALHLQPDFVEAHNNLGNVLLDQGKLDEALACFREAIHLQPEFAEAHTNLGATLHKQGRAEEALASFQQALRLQPDNSALRVKIATLLPVLYSSVEEMLRWRARLIEQVDALLRDNVTIDPLKENIQSNFLLAYQGLDDREIQEKIARLYRPSRHFAPHLADPGGRKLRVGFLSKHFKNHTIGQLNRGLIAHLSREKFEVTVLSLGYHEDEVNQAIRENADHYRELPDNLQAASQRIAELGLDILYFTDIGMEPLSYALASVRLAPVQCVTWGHPMTTGLPTVDYFISSALMEEEEAAAHYSETLVRLDSLSTYYYEPPVPADLKPRGTFGLSEEITLYICPQSLFKFHPDFDAVLGEILRRDPAGELILIDGADPHWNEVLLDRFRVTIPDVVERIRFLPQQSRTDFLNLIALSDVMLDPLHYGGGNSSFEAFAVGTPVVTLPAPFLRGRITLGQYRQMGLLECVAESTEAYIELALRLGTDSAYRSEVREKILAAKSALYEDAKTVRQMEAFFERAVADTYWRQQERG